MYEDFQGFFRALAFILFLLLIAALCAVRAQPDKHHQEEPTPQPQPTDRAKILLAGLEEEPTQTWTSLGTYELTAYCSCEKCCGKWAKNRPTDPNGNPIVYTSIGAIAKAGTTIAVDPTVIPYGSEIQIDGHTYIAQDNGGAIKGNRIDIYFDNHQEAIVFGRQTAEIFIKTTHA